MTMLRGNLLALALAWTGIASVAGDEANLVMVQVASDGAAPGYEAWKALDGDPATFWHTPFGPANPRPPHELVVDLGRLFEITGLEYLPRQQGGNGAIQEYQVFVSRDEGAFPAPCAAGAFDQGDDWKRIEFPTPMQARYVKLRALSEGRGQPWTSVAELKILAGGVEFRAVPSSWRLIPGHVGPPRTELQRQFVALTDDLDQRTKFADLADQTFRPEALILDSDRDPADVVLRRTAALLADLKQAPAAPPSLTALEAELLALRAKNERLAVEDRSARYALFEEACRLRRRIAFANPLLDFHEIVFLKRHRALFNHMCDQYYGMAATPGGGVYVLSDAFGPEPQVRDVLADAVVQNGRLQGSALHGGPTTPPALRFDGEGNLHGPEHDGGTFLSLDLSYDGKTLLFAYVEGRGDMRHQHHTDPARGHWDPGRCYHIFQVNVDGSNLRQLTDGSWNDFDPCWLPNGRIAFISERRGGYLRCGRTCPTYTLFDMASDGGQIRCLSFHETNEWNPSVTNDGRLIWTRWDYVDRHGCTAHMPWITSLDGTDPRPVHGNYAQRPLRPDMELHARAIPGSSRFVATAAPHHGQAYGSLVVIDPNVPDDDGMGPVKRLTPEIGFPETQGGSQVYGTAWPLSEHYYLCVHGDEMRQGAGLQGERFARGDYGIYLVDAFGNKELIYRDPEIASLSPIPLRSRPKPPARPTVVTADDALRSNPATRHQASDDAPPSEATVAVMNVYDSEYRWPADAKITALRVLQLLPMTTPSGRPPHETGARLPEARDSVVPARAVLGIVPVEEDGSAHFVVPAYKEIFFQALDERGRAVQSMRSATQTRAGERLVCHGCHAGASRAPHALAPTPLALARGPSRLTPEVEGANPFSYPLLVQPVLDRHCVKCHSAESDTPPNLGREPLARKWYASYNNLLPYAFTTYDDAYRTRPGQFGARAAKLTKLLDEGHHGVKLSEEELRRISLWLDCVSMFYGVYEQEGAEAQLRGQAAQPTLE